MRVSGSAIRRTNSARFPDASSCFGCSPPSASSSINSARSRPTPSTSRAATAAACAGSLRLTYSFVAVIGAAGVAGDGVTSAATGEGRAAGDGAAPARTSPAAPSTVTTIPSPSAVVAFPVPTTHGTPSSRETIAACDVIPPASVTMAAARRISVTQSGDVKCATSTAPWSSPSSGRASTRTGPDAVPGLAPMP